MSSLHPSHDESLRQCRVCGTPTAPLLPMDSDEAIHAINDVCAIRRWTGSEVMHQSSLLVRAIVGAYNSFLNAVGMDQIRSS